MPLRLRLKKEMRKMKRSSLLIIVVGALAGCNLAPEYQRPSLSVSNNWPDRVAQTANLSLEGQHAQSIAWQDFIVDGKLKQLISLALNNNRDLRAAAFAIEKAQAQYQIQRSNLFPHINATAGENASLTPNALSTTGAPFTSHVYSVGLGFSAYEIDFFGHVRNLKDQALELYLSTEEAHRSLEISLISEVASAYLTLGADQERLSLANETMKAQQTSFDLNKRRFEVGSISQMDLNQYETALDAARESVSNYTNLVAKDVNALTLLVGSTVPAELMPSRPLDSVTAIRELPVGLPSDLLENRPDILSAEHQLKAANANIGVARSAFFPSITLTGSVGRASVQMDGLFDAGSRAWAFSPQLNLPIFNDGSNTANLNAAKADREIYLAQYDKAIQSAFREVADTLADQSMISTQVAAQQSLVDATASKAKLTSARFDQGIDSYLTVLDANIALYTAQSNLVSLKLAQSASLITLYKALGGSMESLKE
jgi:outer membrane protein, multidrug efflux system